MEMKKRKTLLGILAIVGVLSITIGVSVAFFNYTRTGGTNTIRVGRISFVTRQTKTISLNNLFPIDPTNSEEMSDETKVGTLEIEIEGDTDYAQGVEYLVSSENTNITTSSGKVVPISLDVEITNLGTSNPNYFTAREDKNATIYKKLVGDTLVGDQMLLVGYIKPNTTSGTAEGIQNGKLTIKAYLDENKILISDTYDGTESDNMGTPNEVARGKTVLTTTEWNALSASGVSFQIKVEANEGIWVKGSLEEIMKTQNLNTTTNQPIMDNVQSEFVSASTGIDFSQSSSDTNGKGVYMRAGTENDAYPILYYRGDVTDNNVIFNNKCWKSVRTTDTGGVKLIYNGELSDAYVSGDTISRASYTNVSTPVNAFTYDTSDNSWNITITDGSKPSISFNVPAGDNYSLVMTGTSGSTTGGQYSFYKNGTSVYSQSGGGGVAYAYTYSYGTLTATDIVKFSFSGSGTVASPITFKLIMKQNGTAISQSNYTIVGESFAFDETTQKWSSTVEQNKQATIGFNVSVSGNYFINYTNPNGGPFYIYRNGTSITTSSGTQKVRLLNLQPTDKIIVDYSQYTSGSGVVEFYITEAENTGLGCQNNGTDTQITMNINGTDKNTFEFSGTGLYNSPAYNGYMYGTVYEFKTKASTATMKFGTGFTFSNGIYTLTNAENGIATGRHYTCFTSSDTCSGTDAGKIYYAYLKFSNNYYYTEIENGKSIEDAFKEMQENTTNSNAKTQIDAWYAANMNTVTNKLEDTIWCNDRSISEYNGFVPSGTSTASYLYYSAYTRSYSTHSPSLVCANKNDAFTVSNGKGNQKLQYPVAMLTADEINLAGKYGNHFLNNGSTTYWSLSPYHFNYNSASGIYVGVGSIGSTSVHLASGLRPSVSLKPGTPVVSGDGTANNPYKIG